MSRLLTLTLVIAFIACVAGTALALPDNLAGPWPTTNHDLARTGWNPNIPYKFGAWTSGGVTLKWSKTWLPAAGGTPDYPYYRPAYGQQLVMDENSDIYFRSATTDGGTSYGLHKIDGLTGNKLWTGVNSDGSAITGVGNLWVGGCTVGANAVYATWGDSSANNTGCVMAFDKATGYALWKTVLSPAPGQPSGSRMAPALYDGKLYIVGLKWTNGLPIWVVDAATGAILAQGTISPFTLGDQTNAPTFVPNVFGTGKHGLYMDYDAGNLINPAVYAVEVDTNTNPYTISLKWSQIGGKVSIGTGSRCIYSSVTNRIYTKTWGDYSGYTFFAYDAVTGELKVKVKGPSGHGWEDIGYLKSDGRGIIAGGFDGQIVDYTDNGDSGTWKMHYQGPRMWGEEWGPSCTVGSGKGVMFVTHRQWWSLPLGMVAIDGGTRCIQKLWDVDIPWPVNQESSMRAGQIVSADGTRVYAFGGGGRMWCWEAVNQEEAICGSLSGTVKVNGEPAGGAWVGIKYGAASQYATASPNQAVQCDATGKFGPINFPAGTVLKVAAWTPGGKTSTDTQVTIVANSNVTVNFDLALAGAYLQTAGTAITSVSPAPSNIQNIRDGSPSTGVGFGVTLPQWAGVDLGANKTCDEAIIWAGDYYFYMTHKIQALPDGYDPMVEDNWTNYATTVYSQGELDHKSIYWSMSGYPAWNIFPIRFMDGSGNPVNVTGRYWRVYVQQAFWGGVQWDLFEIELHDATTGAVNPADNAIGSAKALPDTSPVGLMGKVVTANGGVVPGDSIYIEDPGRASGIRVITGTKPAVGKKVYVAGTMTTTADGERAIQATTVADMVTSAPVAPLGINNRSIPLDMTAGMLVKVYGTVFGTDPNGGFFYINDGTQPAGMGYKVVSGWALPKDGDFVTVVGVIGRESGGVPVIWATTPEFFSGIVSSQGWLKSWDFQGAYCVAQQSGWSNDMWEQYNLAEPFFAGEPNIAPVPGDVGPNGGKWFIKTGADWGGGFEFNSFPFVASPFNQRVAYAVVWVKPDQAYTELDGIQIWVAHDDGCKIYVGDNWAATRPGFSSGEAVSYDDGLNALTLSAGWNRVIFKSNDMGGGWGFALRFEKPDPNNIGAYIPIPLEYSVLPM